MIKEVNMGKMLKAWKRKAAIKKAILNRYGKRIKREIRKMDYVN